MLLRPGPIPSDDGGVDSVVGTGLACAVGGEDEFCTVTGLALLVGFFGGPILGGYVAFYGGQLQCRWATRLADGQEPSYRRREHGDRAHAAQPRAPSVRDSRLRPSGDSGTGRRVTAGSRNHRWALDGHPALHVELGEVRPDVADRPRYRPGSVNCSDTIAAPEGGDGPSVGQFGSLMNTRSGSR